MQLQRRRFLHLAAGAAALPALSSIARAQSCMERENLAGDAKGKSTSGSNREAESTDPPERGGLPCSSDEAG
jgi:hypothetical protein